MAIRDLDDYELIKRWRDVRVDAALCVEPGPKRFMAAYVAALKDEMESRAPGQASEQAP